MEEEGREDEDEKWVRDSSLDYKGTIPARDSTGVWRASFFVIALEFSERLSYFGLVTNLFVYFIKVLHHDLGTAAKNVNYWTGVTTLMPLIGGFVADAYMGRFPMVIASSIIYLTGLVLLTMSQYIPHLKPCDDDACLNSKRPHEAAFFAAMYMISFATGGFKPALESFGADQFDDDHTEERKKKMSFFNCWNAVLCCGLTLGVSVIVYVEDHAGWGVAEVILASVMAICIVIFILGRPYFRYRSPNGSTLTPMLHVVASAIAKRNLPLPNNPHQLYEGPASQQPQNRVLPHTNKLRCLDKAAIVECGSMDQNPWRLASVTQVEETKLIINVVPIWLTSLMFCICYAQSATFFVKQGLTMDSKLTAHFNIPPASMTTISAVSNIITIILYDRILVPYLRRVKQDERGISILKRIGIGMVLSILTMAIAAVVERERLVSAERNIDGGHEMSIFWLAPQFLTLGIADGFTLVGLQEYFYDQVPDGMRSLGIAFFLSVIGTSNFLSSLLITGVENVTRKGGRHGWFSKDLNKGHLDYFYWLLFAMSGVNLCAYVYVARKYSYKRVDRRMVHGTSIGVDGVE